MLYAIAQALSAAEEKLEQAQMSSQETHSDTVREMERDSCCAYKCLVWAIFCAFVVEKEPFNLCHAFLPVPYDNIADMHVVNLSH